MVTHACWEDQNACLLFDVTESMEQFLTLSIESLDNLTVIYIAFINIEFAI